MLGIATLSMVIGTMAIASGPAAASAAPMQTFNLCGDWCKRLGQRQYRAQNSHDKVVWYVNTSSSAVWYVGLTEACSPAVAYIAFHLPTNVAYTVHHFPHDGGENPQTGPCLRNNYGNASIELGSTLGANTVALPTSDDMHCVLKQGFGFAWRGCVAHLKSHGEDPVLKRLVKADLARMEAWWSGHPGTLALGGDFNLKPEDVDDYFSMSDELDPHLGITALMQVDGSGLNRKIDWVIGRRTFFSGGRSATRNCDAGYSDHCYLLGSFHTP